MDSNFWYLVRHSYLKCEIYIKSIESSKRPYVSYATTGIRYLLFNFGEKKIEIENHFVNGTSNEMIVGDDLRLE